MATIKTYCLVRYSDDGVFYVCPEGHVREDDNNVTFAKFKNQVFYRCRILCKDQSKKFLMSEMRACIKRMKSTNYPSTQNGPVYLVRFIITRDFTVYLEKDINVLEDSMLTVQCPDGVIRQAQLIATGAMDAMMERLRSINIYYNMATPERKNIRNPLIPWTPRVIFSQLSISGRRSYRENGSYVVDYPSTVESDPHSEEMHINAFGESCSPPMHRPIKRRRIFKEFQIDESCSPTRKTIKEPECDVSREESSLLMSSHGKSRTPSPIEKLQILKGIDIDNSSLLKKKAMEELEKDISEKNYPLLLSSRSTKSMSTCFDGLSNKSDTSEPYSADSDDDPMYCPTSSLSSATSMSSRSETPLNVQVRGEIDLGASFAGNQYSRIAKTASPLNVTEITPSVNMLQVNSSAETSTLPKKSSLNLTGDNSLIETTSHGLPLAQVNIARQDHPIKKKNTKNQHACAFCGKLVMRIRRHYKTVHKDESTVVRIATMPDGPEKERSWKTLRLEGTFRHNSSVLERGTGKFLVQRYSDSTNLNEYLSCLTCKGWFKSKSLHQHVRKCNPQHIKYSRVQSISTFGLPKNILQKSISGPGLKILMKDVFPRMKVDKVSKVIQSDYIISKWGASYAGMRMQKKDKAHLRKVVSQNMRLLGRLLIILRKHYGSDCELAQFIRPEKFDAVTQAVSEVSGDCKGVFKVPSIPLTLGYILKACAAILRSDGYKNRDHNLVQSSDEFLNVYKHDWHKILSCRALEQLREEKYKRCNVRLLPLADDIIILTQYLKEELKNCSESLAKTFSYEHWSVLSKVLLVSMLVFNRKRVGDIQRIKVDSYKNRTTADKDSELYNSLNDADRIVSKGYAHLYTRGKKGRYVPVMIHLSLIPFIELVLKFRKEAGVLGDNPYLFARGSTYFDGCEALRSLSKKSGARQHQLLRSTALRKHIATMSQVMNLSQADLDILATYMGHSIDVHRRFYRIPDRALHLARISRLLMAVSSNEVGNLKGKDLEHLPIPDEESTVEYLMPLEVNVDEHQICDDLNIDDDPANQDAPVRSGQKQKPHSRIAIGSKPEKTSTNWTREEKDAVLKHLAYCVQEKRAPQKAEVEKCMAAEVVLQKRKWTNIKDFVRNYFVSKSRKEKCD